MGNKNKRTTKAVAKVEVVALPPVFMITNATTPPVANTVLTVDEDNKVTLFVGLNGTIIQGTTVEDLVNNQLGDAHCEKLKGSANRYSARIGGGHRIEYIGTWQNGQQTGDRRQFSVTIMSIGNATYKH